MDNLKEKLGPMIEAMEAEGKKAKNVAELEQILLRYQDELMGTSFESLAKKLDSEGFSPLAGLQQLSAGDAGK